MALMAKNSPLIAGSSFQEVNMGLKSVKAIRAFYSKGKPVNVGEIVSVPSLFASELIASNKAEAVIIEVPVNVIPVKEEAIDTGLDGNTTDNEPMKTEMPKWKGGNKHVR